MSDPEARSPLETCWTLILAARAGDGAAREAFARRYLPAVRAYLASRWRGSPLLGELEDGVQEVFLACLREGGALENLERGRGAGFRAYLFGIVRNAALHVETRRAREHARRGDSTFHPEEVEARDAALSRLFDREWARALLREAGELQAQRAAREGPEAERRVELLRLRFQEDRPIREIAALWQAEPARLHHEYARARKEFLAALREILGLHETGTPEQLRAECDRILGLLG